MTPSVPMTQKKLINATKVSATLTVFLASIYEQIIAILLHVALCYNPVFQNGYRFTAIQPLTVSQGHR